MMGNTQWFLKMQTAITELTSRLDDVTARLARVEKGGTHPLYRLVSTGYAGWNVSLANGEKVFERSHAKRWGVEALHKLEAGESVTAVREWIVANNVPGRERPNQGRKKAA